MPAPAAPTPQRKVTVFMKRKPTDTALAEAKRDGKLAPPATTAGSFTVDGGPVDKVKAAAKAGAAERLKVAPSKLLVNVGPAGAPGHVQVFVTAPPEGAA